MPEPLPPLREVIARFGIDARRGLGQHFLNDLNLTRRIVRSAGDLAGRTVLEVGPGPGGLTRALLETDAARVVAVERDRRCVAALADLSARDGRLEVVEGNALEIDPGRFAGQGERLTVVANLPFNVATALLIRWLRRIEAFESLTLMFQKEVAERICARPREPAYGRLAVITGWLAEAERLFDVAPSAFVPPPKVVSTVIRLVPRAAPLAPAPFAALEAVTAAAFGHRRKMMRSALKGLVADPERLLAAAGVEPTARAETLPIEQFCALARLFAEEAGAGLRGPGAGG